ncbi:MAG: aspartate carbamoyltransferase [Candidatus Micrarchaeota archaeon]|nr:aspartate carbamoyltransferase [Candidatus Micrarchaeota archaeon]MDE1848031.1 aspartate carbamoyltransferase [Candidatus Micrarchaeota archaeon]MDE1864592.1 aspartate carbamoyltransferase [Candidatus Micrarchaeota archaeon]
MQRLKHFVESQQLNRDIIFDLFRHADRFRSQKWVEPILDKKILMTLFYEPSTRTRLSFESAMTRLGGHVLTTENAKEFSSAVKGESIEDTIRVVSSYAHCIVIRHHENGSIKRAAELSKVPVINAGDGSGQHPTQALLDLYTIYKEIGRIRDIKVAMVGDLKNGRTTRSLSYLLGKFPNIQITFISAPNLKMSDDVKTYLARHNVKFDEGSKLGVVLPEVDVVYMTRIQKERMGEKDYKMANGNYIIDESNFNLLKPEARIMHPLPKVGEIKLPVDVEEKDPRVAYFRQAENGLYVRMAVLEHLIRR